MVALSLGTRPDGVIEQDNQPVQTAPGVLSLVDLSRPYVSHIPRGTDGWSMKLPLEALALPLATVRAARPRLATSPVHEVFAQHMRTLARQAPGLDAGLSSELVGSATIALARALISSAAEDSRHAPLAMADTLLLRVQAYIRRHLTDPTLTPEGIAAAHHVSVRHLYKTFAEADLRLEQWIIGLRLEAARAELARPESRHRTIGAITRQWGFTNVSHFNHRFRAAYGMTPREWQERSPGRH